jgi:hypothetical protein
MSLGGIGGCKLQGNEDRGARTACGLRPPKAPAFAGGGQAPAGACRASPFLLLEPIRALDLGQRFEGARIRNTLAHF